MVCKLKVDFPSTSVKFHLGIVNKFNDLKPDLFLVWLETFVVGVIANFCKFCAHRNEWERLQEAHTICYPKKEKL